MSVIEYALDILDNLHELSGASTTVEFRLDEVSDRLGFDGTSLQAMLDHLANVGLIRRSEAVEHGYFLTRKGINTVEHTEESDLTQPQKVLIDVFISHSSKDRDLAVAVVDLLGTSMNLESSRIRCTSADGYRLPIGVRTEDQLREEVNSCQILMGLLTPDSLASAYVLFELGARWGIRRPLFPLVAKGLRSEELRGPLAGINVLNCSSRSRLHQLVANVSSELKRKVERPAVYESALDILVAMADQQSVDTDQKSKTSDSDASFFRLLNRRQIETLVDFCGAECANKYGTLFFRV